MTLLETLRARQILEALRARPWSVPALIALVSATALASAMASEIWGGLQPCILCYYQRYAYWAALAIGLAGVAAARFPGTRRPLVLLGGLAFLTGAAIAAFHVGVEQHWWRGTDACHAPTFDPEMSIEDMRKMLMEQPIVTCDSIPWSLFGISMAGYNVLASLIFAGASFWAAARLSKRT
jgi:disulfide bond formation protein DsbB